MINNSRREVIKLFGASTLATGAISSVSADSSHDIDDLRLISDVSVDGTHDLDVQGNYVYVAAGEGMAVVDWRNPTQPRKVVEVNVPGVGINDVKVEDGLLAVSSQGARNVATATPMKLIQTTSGRTFMTSATRPIRSILARGKSFRKASTTTSLTAVSRISVGNSPSTTAHSGYST